MVSELSTITIITTTVVHSTKETMMVNGRTREICKVPGLGRVEDLRYEEGTMETGR